MTTAVEKSLSSVSAERILKHIEALSSDAFAGRKPGTDGEKMTLAYLVEQCQKLGLSPAGDNGTYLQHVAVTGITSTPTLTFTLGEKQIAPGFPDQYVAMSRAPGAEVKLAESEIVFVGYGIKAPEFGWDDYKGIDVRGKTVLMLISDPRRPDPNDAKKLDQTFFRGNAMTYYGRWTYKYEIASELGASAALIIHDTAGAGYGFDVVKASWSGESFELPGEKQRVAAEGWICQEIARELFSLSELDLDQLRKLANQHDFQPVKLDTKANFKIKNVHRNFASANVVAALPMETGTESSISNISSSNPSSSNPSSSDVSTSQSSTHNSQTQEPQPQECIVYCAHWDHFGTKSSESAEKPEVYSGAVDNASGVAVVLEIARALQTLPEKPHPRRTALFLFSTLEEFGLLGSQYYVQHPSIPLSNTLAIFNLDILNVWGRTRKVVSTALGHSTLDDDLAACAASQGRTIASEPEPDKGYFYRSDHLEFIRRGVPAIFFLQPGADFVDKPEDFGERKRLEYLTCDYHKVSDKIKPDWDLSGTVEDAQLLVITGLKVLQNPQWPQWHSSSEFYTPRQST